MPTGGSAGGSGGGPTGHLLPTGGSMDDYIERGIAQTEAMANDSGASKPAITAYMRQVVAPQAFETYTAVKPLIHAVTQSGPNVSSAGHEGRRLFDRWDNLRSLTSDVGTQVQRSFSGEDVNVPPEQATAKALTDLRALRDGLTAMSWQQPQQLKVAVAEIDKLMEALSFEAIAAKVVQ